MWHTGSTRIVDTMVLTILFAVPGLLVLVALAATPLFALWDDRASDRAVRDRRPQRTEVVIPAPRRPADAVGPVPVNH
jgi:hypothetical protein